MERQPGRDEAKQRKREMKRVKREREQTRRSQERHNQTGRAEDHSPEKSGQQGVGTIPKRKPRKREPGLCWSTREGGEMECAGAGAQGREGSSDGHPSRRAGCKQPRPNQGCLLSSSFLCSGLLAIRGKLGQQRFPEPLLARSLLPPSFSRVVNLGGQVGLLLAISKGQLRSICGDTGSECHLSLGA